MVPAWHTPPLQQPLQLPGPQVVALLQVPLTHCWSPVQAAHSWPLVPQAATSLPPLQTLFSQQPTQVVGPQVVLHAWSTHLSAPEQTAHWAPFLPQADCWAPDMHMSPWQQPSGHEAAVQVQSPLTQARPVPQALHAPPPVPQRSATSPGWQVPCESQQPEQFDGPQFCDWVSHLAFTHACSEVHSRQAVPPVPQAV